MESNLILLDRDGVINFDSDNYIKTVDEWIPIPGSIDSIARLSMAKFTVMVVTNQSGLSRKYFSEATLSEIHQKMIKLVERAGGLITAILFCPHLPDDNCTCRKPRTGMLSQIEDTFSLSVLNSWFIGDSEKDIDVAITKGCKPILVLTGKGNQTLKNLSPMKRKKIHVFQDLTSAVDYILNKVEQ